MFIQKTLEIDYVPIANIMKLHRRNDTNYTKCRRNGT